jgi:antitoxin ParD1/3/4
MATAIIIKSSTGVHPMAKSMNLSLTDELSRYVDSRAGDNDLFSSPDEYIRDLIRRDMQDWSIVTGIARGLREAKEGAFAPESILDILRED